MIPSTIDSLRGQTFDVVVVGGGLAGLELAKELRRSNGGTVLILEAGPPGDATHVNMSHDAWEALTLWLDPEHADHLWRPWMSANPPFYTRHGGLRRRLGGRSLYWHGVVLPIESWALAEPWWPGRVVDDLTKSWRGGPGLYEAVRSDLAAWAGGGLQPDAGTERGEVTLGGYALSRTPQAIRRSSGNERWEAYSPLSQFPSTAGVDGDSVTLLTDSRVLGVVVEDGRAVGVKFRHSAHGDQTVRAGVVVLAAAAIESARLAIQALHEAAVITAPALPGLVDHLEQGFLAVLDPKDLPRWMVDSARQDTFWYAPCTDEARSNLFVRLYLSQTAHREDVVLEAWTTGEQERSESGRVVCDRDTPWPWAVTVESSLTETDWDVIGSGRRVLQEFWADFASLTRIQPTLLTFPDFNDPTRTLADVTLSLKERTGPMPATTWCALPGTVDHEGGTLPLGELLDDRHEFLGIGGLFAVGPATFPRMGAANPSLTALALARRLAGILTEK